MSNKFLKKIMIVFYLSSIPVTLVAMEFDEQQTETTPLTSKQLRENVRFVKKEWWQSVEVITPTEEWSKWASSNWDTRGAPPYYKWDKIWGYHGSYAPKPVCCCFSSSRNENDLVVLEEYWYAVEKEKSVVMLLKDACEIMRRENEETFTNHKEETSKIRKKEEEISKEYEIEKKFFNYTDGTYKHGDLAYWTSPFREYPKDNLNPKIMEDLKKADRDKRNRQRSKELEKARRADDLYNQKVSAEKKAKEEAWAKAEAERKRGILDSIRGDDSPETQRRKYWEGTH